MNDTYIPVVWLEELLLGPAETYQQKTDSLIAAIEAEIRRNENFRITLVVHPSFFAVEASSNIKELYARYGQHVELVPSLPANGLSYLAATPLKLHFGTSLKLVASCQAEYPRGLAGTSLTELELISELGGIDFQYALCRDGVAASRSDFVRRSEYGVVCFRRPNKFGPENPCCIYRISLADQAASCLPIGELRQALGELDTSLPFSTPSTVATEMITQRDEGTSTSSESMGPTLFGALDLKRLINKVEDIFLHLLLESVTASLKSLREAIDDPAQYMEAAAALFVSRKAIDECAADVRIKLLDPSNVGQDSHGLTSTNSERLVESVAHDMVTNTPTPDGNNEVTDRFFDLFALSLWLGHIAHSSYGLTTDVPKQYASLLAGWLDECGKAGDSPVAALASAPLPPVNVLSYQAIRNSLNWSLLDFNRELVNEKVTALVQTIR